MSADRRAFIASMGGAFMACGFRFVPRGASIEQATLAELDDVHDVCRYVKSSVGYRDWLLVGRNSKVTALTGRTELGQGLTTVIVALVRGHGHPARQRPRGAGRYRALPRRRAH